MPPQNFLVLTNDGPAEVKDVPLDQVLVLPGPNQPSRPDRGSKIDDSWRPEIVVDMRQVVREDQVQNNTVVLFSLSICRLTLSSTTALNRC